jgi:hypothetical protein
MKDEQLPGDDGSSENEPEVDDADLPSDEEEDAEPPADDSVTPVDPDSVEGAG